MNIYINNWLQLLVGDHAVFLYNSCYLAVSPHPACFPSHSSTSPPFSGAQEGSPVGWGCPCCSHPPRGAFQGMLWALPTACGPRWPGRAGSRGCACSPWEAGGVCKCWSGLVQRWILPDRDRTFLESGKMYNVLPGSKPDVRCCRAEHLLTSSDCKFWAVDIWV